MKLTKLTSSISPFISGILALRRDQYQAFDNISLADLPSRSIAQCPKDHWRPLAPYTSTAFPNPWWFLPDADQANKDHYDATHPSLPPGIIVPHPLLPSDNITIKELYALAIESYDDDMRKSKTQVHLDCDRWLETLNKFDIMCRCVHMWWWQCSEVGLEVWQRTFDKQTYLARYRRLKGMLEVQMRREGLIELGKRLKDLIAANDKG